ncbi:MAG TPA: HAMP domain-containing sensor histidine kinase [Rudaea sp.]|jgi:signal transduction histidine kinase|nr:HAMP domain-containing sensor histidine kinase [Rudaea sp.]
MSTKPNQSGVEHSEFDLGGFVRHLAHEIANPLNAIMMNAEMAKSLVDRGDIGRANEALARLVNDCTRCAKLMRGMQNFGAGVDLREKSEISAHELIEGATSNIVFEYSGPLPAFTIDAASLRITGDRAALERTIVALIRNAAEAGASDMHLTAREDGDDIVIDVRDNGSGLDAKGIERVSTSFYSSKRAAGGLGLGLTLARELVRKHGGSVAIRANSPAGLHVELRLPGARG